MRTGMAAVIIFALTLAAEGCATAPPPSRFPPADVMGQWEGVLVVTNCDRRWTASDSRCLAVNDITLTLLQDGTRLNGAYHCAFGNQICRNGGDDDVGAVRVGYIRGKNVYVTVEIKGDGSTCRFNGRKQGKILSGGYECLQGGGVVEQGTWKTTRLGG